MAKTAEQKATAAVAKAESKPTPANVAAAAKAVAVASGASKTEVKAAVADVNKQVTMLKDSQALENSIVGSKAVKTENKTELTTALKGMLANDFKLTTPVTATSDPEAAKRIAAAQQAAALMNITPGLQPAGIISSWLTLHVTYLRVWQAQFRTSQLRTAWAVCLY